MATVVHDCSNCGAKRVAFEVAAMRGNKMVARHWNAFLICGACGYAAVADLHDSRPQMSDLTTFQGDITAISPITLISFKPERGASVAPEHVPLAASRAYVEAVDSLKDGRYTAAVAMFRRAVDVGLKEFPSDVEAWKLEKRIDKLATAGLITEDLKKWAHKIRLEGNEAVHELDEPSREQAEELRLFTELLLTYLFTLPAKVKGHLGGSSSQEGAAT